MTQNTVFADDEAFDPQSAPGFGTQLLAFSTAACVGIGLLLSSVVIGAALFVIVLVTMNIDAGAGWTTRIRERVAGRNRRILKQVLSPQ